jgi:hypothetical protein
MPAKKNPTILFRVRGWRVRLNVSALPATSPVKDKKKEQQKPVSRPADCLRLDVSRVMHAVDHV